MLVSDWCSYALSVVDRATMRGEIRYREVGFAYPKGTASLPPEVRPPMELPDPDSDTISTMEFLARLEEALARSTVAIEGGASNRSFLLELLGTPNFRAGPVTTRWLDRYLTDMGASNTLISFAFLAFGIPFALLASRGGRTADRVGPLRAAVAASVLMVPITMGYGFLTVPLLVVVLSGIEGVVQSLGAPAAQALVASLVRQRVGLVDGSELTSPDGLARVQAELVTDLGGSLDHRFGPCRPGSADAFRSTPSRPCALRTRGPPPECRGASALDGGGQA